MYAYKYNTSEYQRNGYSRQVPLHIVKKAPKRRKKNPLKRFIALFITLPMLLAFAYFIMPLGINRLTIPLIIKNRMPLITNSNNYFANKNSTKTPAVRISDILTPTANYIENEYFLGTRLFVKNQNSKLKNEMADLYLTDVMYDLKLKLKNLEKNYPTLTPSVFVWDFNSGNYVDINASSPYPAASIIKIPVLISLFKSNENGSVHLYEDMQLTNYYRSSGSGHLQYFGEGATYTVDNLAKLMMQDSDNTATNMIMAKIGSMTSINADLRKWKLNDTYIDNWLPDLKGTNVTSSRDIAKILCNLDNPSFLNVNSRGYIYDYMSHIKNNSLIPQGMPEGTPFVHKTGDIGTMLGDAGIVHLPDGRRYVVVILVKRPHNSPSAASYIRQASSIIYDHFTKS